MSEVPGRRAIDVAARKAFVIVDGTLLRIDRVGMATGHSEAALAALAGVAPLPASSGSTRRHRLNRGGDRRLNRALYTVALTRLGRDPRTRAYLARRTTEGGTDATSSASSSAASARTPPTPHRHPATTKHRLTVIEATH
ncbi:transposase [Pseudonocardia sp. S2-4]|uniref:Transposase n=1 Tax=Pseudonocardia humida TaxID=2800819 RepID=A0ABT1A9N4_9PSEU|nr:transposase [Pseudonocardia humida]